MSTINYINLCRLKGREVTISTHQEEGSPKFPPKPKSDATRLLERQLKGYDYRSNRCNTCFEQKSRNGKCSCDQ